VGDSVNRSIYRVAIATRAASTRVSLCGELCGQDAECGKLTFRWRRFGASLDHALVCSGQRPSHHEEGRAHHRRCTF
jgi:hypothetical protein